MAKDVSNAARDKALAESRRADILKKLRKRLRKEDDDRRVAKKSKGKGGFK